MRRGWGRKNDKPISKTQLLKILVPNNAALVEEFKSQV